MKSFLRSLIGCSLWAILVCGSTIARADITGSISGIVTDQSGAVVPGAKVIATALSTNVQQTTVTDAKGFYSFPALNVDAYTVTLAQPGFDQFQMSGITINANSAVRVDIKLMVG